MLSVDGTDCPFEAQGKAFYSHKFKGTGLRYEVGVGIKGGDICWIQGPLPCGLYPDIKIFRLALIHELDADERIEADLGYRGDAPEYVKVAGPLYTEEDYKARRRSELLLDMKQSTSALSSGSVLTRVSGIPLLITLLVLELLLSSHSLPLSMESHCLRLNMRMIWTSNFDLVTQPSSQ